jgi:c-di-GMP-binding flagellar brake protein YcgR
MMTTLSTSSSLDRRTERRIRVRLPIEISGTDAAGARFAERTTSEDLSRGGVAFILSREIPVGVDVDVQIPLPRQGRQDKTAFVTCGRVRHIGRRESGRIIGIEFTGPRFPHLFRSESVQ